MVRSSIRLLVLGLLLAAAVGVWAATRPPTPPDPCEPLAWYIGQVDPQYDLRRDEFRQAVEEAMWVWETAVDRPLFRHDPGGETVVELVYDRRKDTFDRQRELTARVDGLQDDVAWQESRLEALRAEVAEAEAAHRDEHSPESAARVQASVQRYNRAVDVYNATAQRHNQAVRELEEQGDADVAVGSMRRETRTRNGRTEEVRRRVTIAYAGSHAELVLILTHELGHALGIGHVPAERAVMAERYDHAELEYPVRLTDADVRALEGLCAGGSD